MKRTHGLVLGATLAGVLLTLFACTGQDGANGAPGAQGNAGAQGTAGPSGPAGATGPSGLAAVPDGGLPASCLSPCHGFNGIVEQWKTSTHYAAFIGNLNGGEVASWTGPGACGNCHALDALSHRVAGDLGTQNGGVVANATHGEMGYRIPLADGGAGAVGEATYTGTAKVAAVTCVTCHAVTDANDPHRTGQPYTPGSFPLRVASSATDTAFLEKSPSVGPVTGSDAGAMGLSNTCVYCHRSRKDVTNYIVPTNNKLSTYWGPHEGPQADVYSGSGGYHFAGKTYASSTHQAKLTCVDCHMPDVATNSGAANHSFYAQLSACTSCHAGATSFDVGGGQSTVKSELFLLQAALAGAGYITRTGTPMTQAELSDGQFALDVGAPVTGLTANQAGAVYNYFLLARGGALGAHNPKYTEQLIYDSLETMGALPIGLTRPQ